MSFNEVSLASADSLRDKIIEIIHDREFHNKRRHLWEISRRYNPMNIAFLYEGMFNHIRRRL